MKFLLTNSLILMSNFCRRRHWQNVTVKRERGKFTVCLDDKPAKTFDKKPITVPTRALAALIADEFVNIENEVNYQQMFFTIRACRVLDWLVDHQQLAVGYATEYAEYDLLCYREQKGTPLADWQDEAWQPIVEWAETKLHCSFNVGRGLVPIPQPQQTIINLRRTASLMPLFRMASFIEMVKFTGSFLLGLAIIYDYLTPEEAWDLSIVDEEWQSQQWGWDPEAKVAQAAKWQDFLKVCEFEQAVRK